MKRGATATVGGEPGRRVRAQFLQHPAPATTDPGVRDRTLPQSTPLIDTSVPRYERLWMGDNGRITCSGLRCAGMTAHYAGMKHDLSGGAMERITLDDIREFSRMGITPVCEGCGAEASVLA